MKVGELKSELESLGVSTKSFFEKSEFVRALAEARVDGVKKSKKKKRRTVSADDEEVEEVTAKVEVITNDSVGPKTKKSRDNSAESASAGGNPFGGGGGGSPFGGMPFGGGGGAPGGMGGMDIGDILKNMGGMGGGGGAAGGNPFAGAGGGSNPFAGAAGGANPFGGGAGMEDAMKAAQAAMGNPKVQKVLQKAQSWGCSGVYVQSYGNDKVHERSRGWTDLERTARSYDVATHCGYNLSVQIIIFVHCFNIISVFSLTYGAYWKSKVGK